MAWFSKQKKLKSKESTPAAPPAPAAKGEGIWYKCEACSEVVSARRVRARPGTSARSCGQHIRSRCAAGSSCVLDPGSFQELDAELDAAGPARLLRLEEVPGPAEEHAARAGRRRDAFISGVGAIDGQQVSIGSFAFEFMGGSMGSVVGEKVTRVFDRAYERRVPAIVFSSHRRRAHAGGDLLPHADGEDLGRARTASARSASPTSR